MSRKLSKTRDLLHTYVHCVKSLRISGPYSVQICEYTYQKISEYRYFSHSGNLIKTLSSRAKNVKLRLFFIMVLKMNGLENWLDNNFKLDEHGNLGVNVMKHVEIIEYMIGCDIVPIQFQWIKVENVEEKVQK